MEPSPWTMLVSVLSRCPFTQEKGQKNSFKKCSVLLLWFCIWRWSFLECANTWVKIRQEYDFLSVAAGTFLETCWREQSQTVFLTEIYTILYIKKLKDATELLFNSFYFSVVFCVVFVFIQSIWQLSNSQPYYLFPDLRNYTYLDEIFTDLAIRRGRV